MQPTTTKKPRRSAFAVNESVLWANPGFGAGGYVGREIA
jgi:hypothetical protein